MQRGSFEKFRLTDESLKEIKEVISSKENQINSAWLSIAGKSWYENEQIEPEISHDLTASSVEMLNEDKYYFTQAITHLPKEPPLVSGLSVDNVIGDSIETLEKPNGRLDFLYLENFSTEELSQIFEAFKESLSEKGVYNLCCSVDNISLEQSLTILPPLFSKFLMPKIIELESNVSLIKKGIKDCALKFPNEFRNYVLIGLYNSDPKNVKIITELLEILESQKQLSFLLEFVNCTRELKQWHFMILEKFPLDKLDDKTKNKLLKLFLNKANTFSEDKNYSKLIHSFAKSNAPFTEEERLIIKEIATLNRTIHKKLIEKYSKG